MASAATALAGLSLGVRRGRATEQGGAERGNKPPLDLADFEPESMLRVPETSVPKARFPAVDFHTHLTFRESANAGDLAGARMELGATAEQALALMERCNLRALVNLTGGAGEELRETLSRLDQMAPGRLLSFAEPSWARSAEAGYARFQAEEIARARAAGARGLKVLKILGLYLRERVTEGPLVRVDDPRFDPMWEVCGALGMPVAIHVGDPAAFFLPIDRFNERFDELCAHPEWSFYGKDFPSRRELLVARNRVVARHPRTTFVGLHVGNSAEDLGYVGECLDRFSNLHVDIGARIAELGRQPRTAARFFERYQDRILFGTDIVPHLGRPGGDRAHEMYAVYFRFLETRDAYFNYSPGRRPSQGRWRIYGLGLPEGVLRKVYRDNAARLLNLSA